MSAPVVDLAKVKRELGSLKAAVARIEALIGDDPPVDPYERRRRLLQLIYEYDGMDRATLEPILHDHGTNIRWVGQQVKRGFLLSPQQGDTLYRVTPLAVRELGLENAMKSRWRCGHPCQRFAEDWDSDADAIYDEL